MTYYGMPDGWAKQRIENARRRRGGQPQGLGCIVILVLLFLALICIFGKKH